MLGQFDWPSRRACSRVCATAWRKSERRSKSTSEASISSTKTARAISMLTGSFELAETSFAKRRGAAERLRPGIEALQQKLLRTVPSDPESRQLIAESIDIVGRLAGALSGPAQAAAQLASKRRTAAGEVLRARPVEGEIDHEELSREHHREIPEDPSSPCQMSRDGCPSRPSSSIIGLRSETTGERHFLRDRGLLESALARPRNFFGFGEDDIVVLAVVLMAGIARRTPSSRETSALPLRRCGISLRRTATTWPSTTRSHWADEVIALVEHRSTEDDFVRAIRPFVVPR